MNEFDKKMKKIFAEEKEVPTNFTRAIQTAMEKSNKKSNKINRRVLNLAAILLIAIILGVEAPSIYAQIKWNIEYKEFENRPVEYASASIKQAMEEGNEKNIQMEYSYHDNIGVKLDSLMITDDFYSMNVEFAFPKEIQIHTDGFTYGYAVYDENKNVYGVYEGALGELGLSTSYWKKLYKEEDIAYNPKDVFPARPLADQLTGATVITSKEGNMIAQVTMKTPRDFPKSKKLFIRIFNVGYTMYEYDEENPEMSLEQKFKITDAEWKLEVEVPNDFYQRQSISLTLEEEVEGFELKKLKVTETGTNVIFKMDGFRDLVMQRNGNGKRRI